MIPNIHNLQPKAPDKRDGVERRGEWKHHGQALLKSLQDGELDGTLQLINCIVPSHPRHIGEDVLLLSQQLCWNRCSQLNLAHYHSRLSLIVIFNHKSIPKLPAFKVRPPLTGQALHILLTIFKSEADHLQPSVTKA